MIVGFNAPTPEMGVHFSSKADSSIGRQYWSWSKARIEREAGVPAGLVQKPRSRVQREEIIAKRRLHVAPLRRSNREAMIAPQN